jgi:hypothetical protein
MSLDRQCRTCKAADARQRYADDPTIKAASLVRAQRRIRENREAVWRYLSTHPCADCGEADPVVLEFDHVYGDKVERIAEMVNHRGWAAIAAEIDKCVVRCANCHRRKTAVDLGWYAHLGRDHEADAATALAALREDRLIASGVHRLPMGGEEE